MANFKCSSLVSILRGLPILATILWLGCSQKMKPLQDQATSAAAIPSTTTFPSPIVTSSTSTVPVSVSVPAVTTTTAHPPATLPTSTIPVSPTTVPPSSTSTTQIVHAPLPWKLFVLTGDGVVTTTQWPFGEPFSFQIRDAQGAPVPNATVAWTQDSGNAARLPSAVSVTDSNGIVSLQAYADGANPSYGYSASVVTATVATAQGQLTANFHATSTMANASGTFFPSYALQIPDNTSATITVQANTTVPAAIQVGFGLATGPFTGQALMNAGVRVYTVPINPADPTITATCASPLPNSNTVLSNSKGLATCDLKAGSTKGQAWLRIRNFGAVEFTNIRLIIN